MNFQLPENIKYLAIEGVIGAGKSSLVKLLGERFHSDTLFEDFENNPFLESFYQDKKRYAFQTQMFFLLSRHRQIQEHFQQQDLFRPRLISDYIFAKDKIFASLNLDEDELSLYHRVADVLEKQLVKPDFIVYLQADISTLIGRIRQRNRPYEQDMDENYLRALIEAYNTFFHHYQDSPLLIVNTNHIDFVKNSKDMDELVLEIAKAPKGTTFYSPVSRI